MVIMQPGKLNKAIFGFEACCGMNRIGRLQFCDGGTRHSVAASITVGTRYAHNKAKYAYNTRIMWKITKIQRVDRLIDLILLTSLRACFMCSNFGHSVMAFGGKSQSDSLLLTRPHKDVDKA